MTLRLIFLFGWLTLLAPRVLGQPTTITDNSLNRVPADWKGISTENFDLFFPGTSPVMGTIAAQYAEECFFHFTTLMDFRPRHRYSIFLFNDPLAYTESALIKAEQIREPGQTILFDYSFSVLHPGDNAGFYKSIRTQVARLVMGDYYHGGSIQYSIQSNTLLYLPAWYSKGLTAYFGEGWGPQDEMIIGGLKNENLLELALEGDSETEYVIRKSIWHFIVTAYGPEKFSELFYMTRLTRSIESGLITVLGITPKTLTERWREWLLQEVNSAAEGRMELPATIDFKGIRTGEKVRGYAFDRQGKQLALFVSKQGKQRLLLVDIANGNSSELFSINGPADPVQDLVSIKQPLVFSPDGKKIAGVLYKKAKAQFFYIETEGKKKNVASSPVSPSLELVNSISWSNDGKDLVISGLKNGNCNLYLAKAGSWNLVQLTKNGFDELSPVFSSDDQNIYFSSNRDTSTADNLSSAWECRNKYFNIFKIATRGTNSPIERVSVTPLTNEFPVAFTSSFELVCISDESGLRNLVKRNVFLGSAKNISDFRCGMDQAMINDSILLFGVSTKNSTVFYKMAAEKIPLSLWVKK